MPWQEVDIMKLRIQFVAQSLRPGVNFSGLCREYGISRTTGYAWRNRFYEVGGRFSQLEEKSRRPHRSPNRTAAAIEDRVVALRERYGWGAEKLQDLLVKQGIEIPIITINRILKRRGLIEPEERQRPATRRFERSEPNELWQMDFKGEFHLRKGRCYPLTILDDHSRFSVGIFGMSKPRGEWVHRCLVQTFETYGVPNAMLMDHGTPWWSNSNQHGLTWISVFLIKQGIRVYYSGVSHPQTQGKIERFHRTLKASLNHRGMPKTLPECEKMFADFRMEYNEVRPHQALDLAVPASRYRPSRRVYQPDPPEWEYPEGTIVKRLTPQGHLCYRGCNVMVSEALAGERVRIEEVGPWLLVRFRDMYIREIDRRSGRTSALVLPEQELNQLIQV